MRKNDNGITWKRYQELHSDIRTAKRLSAETGEGFSYAYLSAYIKNRWTHEEIRFFATDYLELTRYHEYNDSEYLRTFWKNALDRLAHEDVNAAHIAAYSEAQRKNAKAKNREQSRAASAQR